MSKEEIISMVNTTIKHYNKYKKGELNKDYVDNPGILAFIIKFYKIEINLPVTSEFDKIISDIAYEVFKRDEKNDKKVNDYEKNYLLMTLCLFPVVMTERYIKCLIFDISDTVVCVKYKLYLLKLERDKLILKNCWSCNKVESNMMKCASCKMARYCSIECQKNSWNYLHKGMCKYLNDL